MRQRFRKAVIGVALAAAAGSVACQTSAGVTNPETDTAGEERAWPGSTSRTKFPPGEQIFINHRGILTRIRDPDFHMAAARRAYRHGKSSLAAIEVEKVRGGIDWFEQRAAGQRRRDLELSMRALRKLEKQLRRREVDSEAVLIGVFEGTMRALRGQPAMPVEPVFPEDDSMPGES